MIDYPFERDSPLDPPKDLVDVLGHLDHVKVRLADGRPAVLVTSYDLAKAVLASENFRPEFVLSTEDLSPDNLAAGFMFLQDGPEHLRLRRKVAPFFSSRRVSELRGRMATLAASLADDMGTKDRPVDLVEEYAYPYAIGVVAEVLGVRSVDRERFRLWSDVVLRPGKSGGEGGDAYADLQEFVVDLIDDEPAPGSILNALAVEGAGLNRLELGAMAMGLLMAGYVTTAQAICHGVLRVLDGGFTWQGPVPDRVEELLRRQDEEVGLIRVATSEWRHDDLVVAEGETVIISRVAANRDPAVFDEAGRPAVEGVNRPVLTFGYGVHHCLGAALARLELEVALGEIFGRFPNVRLSPAEDAVVWDCDGMDVSFSHIWIKTEG